MAVSLRGDRRLAVRRTKQGRRYAVLPGGGVDHNESVQEAALRELFEETGWLSSEVLQHLWTLEHEDRVADYFPVTVPVASMVMSGLEAREISSDNTYEPCSILVADLDLENLQPATIRPFIRELAGMP